MTLAVAMSAQKEIICPVYGKAIAKALFGPGIRLVLFRMPAFCFRSLPIISTTIHSPRSRVKRTVPSFVRFAFFGGKKAITIFSI